ncbi:MAG: hypothetical protein ACE5HK_02505 [Candidatus Methylomirabilales bacterium]
MRKRVMVVAVVLGLVLVGGAIGPTPVQAELGQVTMGVNGMI